MATGRKTGAHLQPLRLFVGAVLPGIDCHEYHRLTWGQEIASTLTLAPYIYSFLFLIGLIVMYFFSITLVAGSAAIMLFALSGAYTGGHGRSLLRRLRDPIGGISRTAPARDRSVDVAEDTTR